MAKKKQGTFAQAQKALTRALRDFEKSIGGLVGGNDGPKKTKRSTTKKAKRRTTAKR